MAKKLYVRNNDNTEWVEVANSIQDISNYLTINSASLTYATKEELENISVDLTGYATETFVNTATQLSTQTASAAAVGYLLDGAPSALNTLNELSAALNDDENFAGTVTTALSNKLNIDTASATYATITNLNQKTSTGKAIAMSIVFGS